MHLTLNAVLAVGDLTSVIVPAQLLQGVLLTKAMSQPVTLTQPTGEAGVFLTPRDSDPPSTRGFFHPLVREVVCTGIRQRQVDGF